MSRRRSSKRVDRKASTDTIGSASDRLVAAAKHAGKRFTGTVTEETPTSDPSQKRMNAAIAALRQRAGGRAGRT